MSVLHRYHLSACRYPKTAQCCLLRSPPIPGRKVPDIDPVRSGNGHCVSVTVVDSIAFVFELLHGLGFAGALREVGLPEHAAPLALALFNVGVEAGQLLIIAAFFVLAWAASKLLPARTATDRHRATTTTWSTAGKLALPAAYVIGTTASFWLIERIYGFWV